MINLRKNSHQVVVLILLTALFFTGSLFTGRDFWVEDEARYAEVLREMTGENQWFVPHLDGNYYPDKPPLYFWTAALFSFLTGGITPLAFLMINWLSALGLILTTYFFGRYLFNSFAGFLSALVLMSSMLFVAAAQVVRMDMLFSLFITLAVFSFFRGYKAGRGRYYFFCYLFSALAVLTKGPFGFVFVFLPAAIFLLIGTKPILGQTSPVGLPPAANFLLIACESLHKKQTFSSILFGTGFPVPSWVVGAAHFLKKIGQKLFMNPGLLLFVILVFGWLVLAAVTGHEDFVKNIFSKQILSRAVDSFHHKEPFYYYLLALPPVFLPWFPFLPRAIKQGWLRRWEEPFILLFLWFAPGFLIISIVSCKLFIYLLPLLPPLALFLGYSLSERIRQDDLPGKSFVITGIAAVLFTFGILTAAPIVTGYTSFFYSILFLCILITGILLTFLKKFKALLALLYSGMAVFSMITIIIFAPRLNNDYSPRPLSEHIRRYAAHGYRAGAFRVTRGILSFYALQNKPGTETRFLSNSSILELRRKDLSAFLNSPQKKLLIIKARDLRKLKNKFPILMNTLQEPGENNQLIPGSKEVGKHIFKLNNEQYILIPITGVNQNKKEGGPAP